ncbi:NifB/NifX family molybdenum-iron cluster-binding protein [Persephonella sp.]|uniref:NifB/NifX family molybdenum-iron cluster-binding protein n=1 Tax=Persephonella sp. TaxID=2060922 RepID=UPI0026082BF9|nr:NifB/NifX family molybdenum-iron cluster-binding protein [Persephonella sp.]
MKIAMPVKPKGDDYVLSTAYGKAKFFLIYDTDIQEAKIIENKALNGKGIAQDLAAEHVDVVITNHIGGGAYNALVEKGIKAYFTKDKNQSYKKIIQDFLQNKLNEITPQNFYLIPQHHHH